MRQIVTICGLLIVGLLPVVGCLVIFDVMAFEAAQSAVLKFGGAIVLLGACSALVMFLMGGSGKTGD